MRIVPRFPVPAAGGRTAAPRQQCAAAPGGGPASWLALFAAGVLWVLAADVASAGGGDAPRDKVRFARGVEVVERLQQPITGRWQGIEVRELLEAVARAVQPRLALVLDRRVDPNRKLDLAAEGLALPELVERLSTDEPLGLSRLGDVVYLGPLETARRLRTIAALRSDELARLDPRRQTCWTETVELAWAPLRQPRELALELAGDAQTSLADPAAVPHDLWAAAEGLRLTRLECLTLVLIQFDLTWKWNAEGDQIAIVAAPRGPQLERSYPREDDVERQLARFRAAAPAAVLLSQPEAIVVRGLLEDHEAIRGPASQPRRPAAAAADDLERQRFDLTIKRGKVRDLIDELTGRLKLELVLAADDRAQVEAALARPLQVEVRGATLDELLEAALAPAQLDFLRQGRRLELFPAPRRGRNGLEPPAPGAS